MKSEAFFNAAMERGDRAAANAAIDMAIVSNEQTNSAIDLLYADPGQAIRFPHEGVHDLAGKIAPGQLVFVMANTGQGKTTFLLDTFDRWAGAGLRLSYLGTEQAPEELRTKWAALRLGIPAGVAINREWDTHPEGNAWQEAIVEELGKLDDQHGDQVLFHPDKFITLPKIEQAAQQAQTLGMQALVVDHIDRVETHATENEYLALKKVIRRLKELARDHSLVLVVASQMNRKGREGDRLSAYRPPQLHHMQGGGMKEHEADMVLGLWRPIRQVQAGETAKEFKALMAAARDGAIPPSDVLEKNTMAAVCLKHRTWGNREGERCKLQLLHGRLTDLAERHQYSTAILGGPKP